MNDTQSLIGQTAHKILRDFENKQPLETDDKRTWPQELWRTLESMGLTVAAVPQELGGGGGTLADAMTVLRQVGRHAAPIPLAETFLAGWVLRAAGVAVPSGPLTIAPIGMDEKIRLRRAKGGWAPGGTVRRVPWATNAARIVVVAQADRDHAVALLDPATCTLSPGENLAGEPRDDVCLDDVLLSEAEVTSGGPHVSRSELNRLGALTRSVLMAGALETILEMTVEYAQQRVQFGRPIGKFQAVGQQIAVLAGEVAAAGRAADDAVAAAGCGEAPRAIAIAKARVGEAAGKCAEISHQVHGAIGFSYEYALHRFTRRLWSWRDEFGPESYWQVELGRSIAQRGADSLWAFLSEG